MLGKLSSAERGSDRLAARRRQGRRRGLIAFGVILCIICGALIWGLQQNTARIARVQIFGADQSLSEIAHTAMQGEYLGIIPRDSIFFFPEDRIRADILAAHAEIAAVSIFRNGLTGLTIKIDDRIPVARWCGLAPDATRFDLNASSSRSNLVTSNCYLFDVKGYIFAAAATTTQTINSFVLYAPLANEILEPLRATIANAEKLPSAFDFARQLTTLGSSVTRIILRDGEVDTYLTSGTRITYLLDDEQNAFTALVSARANMNLADGSVEYVDLRFGGKVYLKKKGDI